MLVVLGSLGFSLTAHADVYRISNDPPADFSEIDRRATEARDQIIDGAMCGGWVDEPVGDMPGQGFMSLVRGAPGRHGFPTGNTFSGLARRNDDTDGKGVMQDEETDETGFTFPNTALGLSTSCEPDTTSTNRFVWEQVERNVPGQYVEMTYPHPLFSDPPCNDAVDENGNKIADYHSPDSCRNFCSYLNSFVYEDCRIFKRLRWTDEYGYTYEFPDTFQCACWSTKYLCSEEWTTNEVFEEDCDMDVVNPPPPPEPYPPIYYDMITDQWRPWLDPFTQQPIEWLNPFTQEPIPWQDPYGNPVPWEDPYTGTTQELPVPVKPEPIPVQTFTTAPVPNTDSVSPGLQELFEQRPFSGGRQSMFNPEPLRTTVADLPATNASGLVAQLFQDNPVEQPNETQLILPFSLQGRDDLLYTEPIQENAPGLIQSCIECKGRECRCPQGNCPWLPSIPYQEVPVPVAPRDYKFYLSYYRGYHSQTERMSPGGIDDLQRTGVSDLSQEADIACFGYYRPETDPRITDYEDLDPSTPETGDPANNDFDTPDFRCAIHFGWTKEQLWDTQSFRGNVEPDPNDIDDSLPESRWNPDESPWEPVIGGMSFIRMDEDSENEEVPTEDKIGEAFLTLDDASMEATTQQNREQQYAVGSQIPATDSSVENRTGSVRRIVAWIQRLMQDMAQLITERHVRLRIPVRWMSHLPDIERLLQNTGDVPATEEDTQPPAMTGSIDKQLRAGDDIPGKMLEVLHELFTVKEEEVVVVIPSLSREEAVAYRELWKADKRKREIANKPEIPGTDALIEKLDAYPRQIDKYYAIQGQLTTTVSTLLGVQEDGTSAIAAWMEENIRRYKEFTEEERRRRDMQPLVEEVLAEMLALEDTNMQFCRSGMLTTLPLYLQNYNWNPTRAGSTLRRYMGEEEVPNPDDPNTKPYVTMEVFPVCDGSPGTFPALCLPPEHDFVFDLTSISTRDVPMRIPVLHPIVLKIQVPVPPTDDSTKIPTLEEMTLPDLPPVPKIDMELTRLMQPMDLQEQPKPIEPPPPLDLTQVQTTLENVRDLLRSRRLVYERYWQSVEPNGNPLVCNGDAWGELECMHDERDLIGDVTYLVAGPAVHSRTVMEIQSTHRDSRPSDPAFQDPLMRTMTDPNSEQESPNTKRLRVEPADGWQLRSNGGDDTQVTDEVLEQIRGDMRRKTIQDDGSRTDTLPVGKTKTLAPYFFVPNDTELIRKENPLDPDVP